MAVDGYDAEVYRSLLADTSLAVVVHGTDGMVVEANQAFADMLGYSLPEALQLSAGQVIHPEDREQRDADAMSLLDGTTKNLSTERRLLHKDGSIVWARVRKSAIQHDGQPVVMVIIEDWSSARAERQALKLAASHDHLTGLLNRAGVEQALVAAPATVARVLVMIDVDNLKTVNDSFGHAIGDVLLQSVATALSSALPADSIVGRLAGDEFVAICGTPGIAVDAMLAKRILGFVAVEVTTPSGDRFVPSVSLGTALLPPEGSLKDALRAADLAMYDDKKRRRRRSRQDSVLGSVPGKAVGR